MMNDIQMLLKITKIRNNLENASIQLKNAQDIMEEAIRFNNEGFKVEEISKIRTKLNKHKKNINTKIISDIF